MAVALIFVGNIEFCPYLDNYINILETRNIDYTVYYWDRAALKSPLGARFKAFSLKSKLVKNKMSKLFDFFQYYIWLNTQLMKGYEKIILLDTLSAFIVRHNLEKQKYILEIRDYSYENYQLFKNIEYRIVEKSYCTFISSPGFLNFLPESDKYILIHNISNRAMRKNASIKKNIDNVPIKIVWAGSVRYYSAQIAVISQLKNDKRIQVFYHGTGPQKENLERYCQDNNICNVYFTGRYDEKDKQSLYDGADFVLNAYDASVGEEVKYALSNRFYDAIMMGLPQIVEADSYKAELVKINGLGIIVNSCLKESVIAFYEKYDREILHKTCRNLFEKFLKDNDFAIERISCFLD